MKPEARFSGDDIPVIESGVVPPIPSRPKRSGVAAWIIIGAVIVCLVVVFAMTRDRKATTPAAKETESTTSATTAPEHPSTTTPVATTTPTTATTTPADTSPTGVRMFFENKGWDVFWIEKERYAYCVDKSSKTTITITPGASLAVKNKHRIQVPQNFELNTKEGRIYNSKQSLDKLLGD
jgi:cytoskeletal protein RodZ